MRSIFKSEGVSSGGWLPVIGGLLAATDISWILCHKLPQMPRLSSLQLALTSVRFVALPAFTALAVSWLLWRRMDEPPYRFGSLILSCGAAWVLIPPIGLLLHLDSGWALLWMVIAAWASAASLQRLLPAAPDPAALVPFATYAGPFAMLPAPSHDFRLAFAAAMAFEAAVILFVKGQLAATGALLADAVFLVLWKWSSFVWRDARTRSDNHGTAKMAAGLVTAILITTIALTLELDGDWLARNGWGWTVRAAARADADPKDKAHDQPMEFGYKGVILWTVPKDKTIVAPTLTDLTQLGSAHQKPVVIPFDGPYWYYREPYRSPGHDAHIAQGDPTGVNIRSTDWLPLIMEAHQSLGSSIELKHCRALELDIRNGERLPGSIYLGVILTDSRSPGRPSLTLGGQAVVTGKAVIASLRSSPVDEQLRYAIPARAGITKFDQITVAFFPPEERSLTGPKIALEQFVLLPR